ncbi:MAG: hypothetical protein MMC23_002647 [Stictis urceolatum]|nr:hypothetical protein [Stictis urceolata]
MRASSQTSPGSRRTAPESSSPVPEQWTVDELVQILNTKAFGPADPVLRIDVTDIKDRLARFRDNKHDEGPPAKQARISRIRATCSLTIWDAGSPKQPTIVEQSRKCSIHGKALSSGERGASIALDEPFMVRLDQLQTKKIVSTHVSPELQLSMQVVIMVANEQDPWPPVEMKLPSPKTKTYRDVNGLVRFPLLAAKWHKLPRCPRTEVESTLDLIASQDNNPYRPKLGLKIDASWVASPSALETANRHTRSQSKKSPSISTPEPYGMVAKSDISMDWIFEGAASHLDPLQFSGYLCPLCSGKDFRQPAHFHFHLINSHSLFVFSFTLQFRNDEGRSVAEGTVRVNISKELESNTTDINWQKPNTVFELEAYLKGDESWLGKKTKRNGNLLVPRAPSTPRRPRSRSHDVSKQEIPLSAVTRDADKVPDNHPPRKRRFAVPKAPDENTRFFRLTTKRPLEEGEEVSESDDDIDEEWILQKHADTIDSFTDTTREEKEFIQRFDRHMLMEDVSSDLHSSESSIRFCRLNRRWLQGRAMRFEFHKKVATMKIQGCITRKTIMDCMKIIDEPTPEEDPEAMDIDTPAATPKRTKISDLPDPNAPEAGDIYGRCAICSLGITHPRTHIFCTNPVSLVHNRSTLKMYSLGKRINKFQICPRPDHHLSCVSLPRRKLNWLCSVCTTNTPPHSSPEQHFHDAQTSPDASKRPLAIRSAESSPIVEQFPRLDGSEKQRTPGKAKAKPRLASGGSNGPVAKGKRKIKRTVGDGEELEDSGEASAVGGSPAPPSSSQEEDASMEDEEEDEYVPERDKESEEAE